MTIECALERVANAVRICKKNKKLVVDADMRLLDDLDIDSFEMLMLTNELEVEFDIEIQEKDFDGIVTVGDVVKKLEDRPC
jgi:acyl carrier protein